MADTDEEWEGEIDAAEAAQKAEEYEESIKDAKIPITIGLLLFFPILILDIIDLIPIAGDVTDILVLPINYYLNSIGVSGLFFIIAEILDIFPALQEFPSRTIAWVIIVFIDHFAPKTAHKLEEVGEIAQSVEGKEGEASVAAKAGGTAATAEETARGAARAEGAVAEAGQVEGGIATREGTAPETAGAERAAGGAVTEEGGAAAPEECMETEGEVEAGEAKKRAEGYERMMETEAERPPEEEAQRKDFPDIESLPKQPGAADEEVDEDGKEGLKKAA